MGSYLTGGFGLLMMFVTVVLVLLWIALPIAVFRMKDRMDKMQAELESTNALLVRIAKSLEQKPADTGGSR
ncbi:hypothetical protein VDF70_11920 [Xanthomonas campestris pv. raphani]|uniref:hypothetical protein n=1 Tax=Xanthomonas campestris TaxID=339 RepID=UPI002B236F5A|nr:hypothetical protein [Xanthomonas campestris]MEA9759759.1 hypothetical protein [Xanthomonas campestris pv. raphani]